jgi:hypothetical protein
MIGKLALSLGNIKSKNLDTDTQRYFMKLSDTLLLFSQADSIFVKDELCKPEVLKGKQFLYLETFWGIRNVMEIVKPVDTDKGDEISRKTRDALLKLLKCVKNISMDPQRRESLAGYFGPLYDNH